MWHRLRVCVCVSGHGVLINSYHVSSSVKPFLPLTTLINASAYTDLQAHEDRCCLVCTELALGQGFLTSELLTFGLDHCWWEVGGWAALCITGCLEASWPLSIRCWQHLHPCTPTSDNQNCLQMLSAPGRWHSCPGLRTTGLKEGHQFLK